MILTEDISMENGTMQGTPPLQELNRNTTDVVVNAIEEVTLPDVQVAVVLPRFDIGSWGGVKIPMPNYTAGGSFGGSLLGGCECNECSPASMIFACTLYAVYAVGLRKKPKIGALVLLTFFSYVAFIGSLPGLFYETFTINLVLPGMKGIIILSVIIIFPSFLAQIFFMKGVEKIGPARSGLYTNLVPVFASILAVLLLGELFKLYHLISLILIFLGIYMFEKKRDQVN